MKKSKPKEHDTMYSFTPENTHDLFISLGIYEFCVQHCYERLMLGLGRTVFVFDVESCEIFEKGKK